MMRTLSLIVPAALFLVLTGPARGNDWPQWRGPDRTGLSKETGLLKQWPPAGPPLVWSVTNLGAGYGSIAVKGDRKASMTSLDS